MGPAIGKGLHVFYGRGQQALPCFCRGPCYVRGDVAVGGTYQRAVVPWRFFGEDIHSCGTYSAGTECICQSLLVNKRSSARIYQYGRRLHQCQTPGIYQMQGVLGQRTMQGKDIGLGEELLV